MARDCEVAWVADVHHCHGVLRIGGDKSIVPRDRHICGTIKQVVILDGPHDGGVDRVGDAERDEALIVVGSHIDVVPSNLNALGAVQLLVIEMPYPPGAGWVADVNHSHGAFFAGHVGIASFDCNVLGLLKVAVRKLPEEGHEGRIAWVTDVDHRQALSRNVAILFLRNDVCEVPDNGEALWVIEIDCGFDTADDGRVAWVGDVDHHKAVTEHCDHVRVVSDDVDCVDSV